MADRNVSSPKRIKKIFKGMTSVVLVCLLGLSMPFDAAGRVYASSSENSESTAKKVLETEYGIFNDYLIDEMSGLVKDMNFELGELLGGALLGEPGESIGGIGYYIAADMTINEIPEGDPENFYNLMDKNFNASTFAYSQFLKDKVEDKLKDGIRKKMAKRGIISAGSELFENVSDILEPSSEAIVRIASSFNDSDANLQAILALTNWTSDMVDYFIDPKDGKAPDFIKYNPLVHGSNKILEFSNNLWDTLLESKEYQEFRDRYKTKAEFNRAFLRTATQGIIEGLADIPRELGFGKKNAALCLDRFDSNIQNINVVNPIRESGLDAEKYGRKYTNSGYRTAGRQFDSTKQLSLRVKPATNVQVYKPNIYLYNDRLCNLQQMDIHIEFLRPDLLLKTIPEYDANTGWNVRVSGEGTLSVNREKYEYLFYESQTDLGGVQTEYGVRIPVEGRRDALNRAIEGYAFNKREKEDFLEFWCEKLDAETEYVMYPQETEKVDKMMPLSLSEKPDNYRRLWYAFSPDNGQEIKEYMAMPIERDGFTLVEWGGFFID